MLRLCVTGAREEYFELNKSQPGTMLSSKNNSGGFEGTEDHSQGKIFVISGSPRCPVKTIKSFLSPLNPDNDAPFQRPKSLSATFNPNETIVWYEKCVLGHNSLDNTLRNMSKRAGNCITAIICFELPLSPFYHPTMLKHGKSKLLLATGAKQVFKVIVKGQLSASLSRCHQHLRHL